MKTHLVFCSAILTAALWLNPVVVHAQVDAGFGGGAGGGGRAGGGGVSRGTRGGQTIAPAPDLPPTTQAHLDAAQADLSRALAALQRATKADTSLGNYDGHLPDATGEVQAALANVAEATQYVTAHPEINPLTAASSSAGFMSAQPAVLQSAYRVPGLNMLTAIEALNAALADLTIRAGAAGSRLTPGDIGGYRTKIVADIQQASTDVLACIDYSNKVEGATTRGGPRANTRGPANSNRPAAAAPIMVATTQSHLQATQYYLEQALNALRSALANQFGGHTENAIAAVQQAQTDLTEAVTYVKAHPESDPLKSGPAPTETANIEPPVAPTNSNLQNFPAMRRAVSALNNALSPMLNIRASNYAGPIMGDVGGYRDKLLNDLNQARKEALAGLDYANSNQGPPPVP